MKGAKRGSPHILPSVVERVVPLGAKLVITVPLPPRILSPNGSHGNVYEISKERAIYRQSVGWLAKADKNLAGWKGPAVRVRVSLIFMTKNVVGDGGYRPLDVANGVSAFKAGFDGLVDAGLFSDDRHEVMSLGSVEIDKNSGPGVLITVESV